MALPSLIETKLYKFVNPKILYIKDYNQYAYNANWLIDIDDKVFKDNLYVIFTKVNEHLKVGLQNKQFLYSMVDVLDKKIQWFNDNSILEVNSFIQFTNKIKTIDFSYEIVQPPKKEKYSIEDIIKLDENSPIQLSDHEDYYYDLWSLREKFNFYNESLDYEKVKLFYVMKILHENLIVAYEYLDALIINYDHINFGELDYEKLLAEHGITGAKNDILKSKCHVNFNKKETAHLFATLLQMGILYFNTDNRKNRSELTKFIETNFTCKGDNGSINTIKNLNQEFTPVFYPNEKELIPFLDMLIHKLQEKRSQLD